MNVGDDVAKTTSKVTKLVDSKSVGPGKRFTAAQKKKILAANPLFEICHLELLS